MKAPHFVALGGIVAASACSGPVSLPAAVGAESFTATDAVPSDQPAPADRRLSEEDLREAERLIEEHVDQMTRAAIDRALEPSKRAQVVLDELGEEPIVPVKAVVASVDQIKAPSDQSPPRLEARVETTYDSGVTSTAMQHFSLEISATGGDLVVDELTSADLSKEAAAQKEPTVSADPTSDSSRVAASSDPVYQAAAVVPPKGRVPCRQCAIDYANTFWEARNPHFDNFSQNCQNFISQALWAASWTYEWGWSGIRWQDMSNDQSWFAVHNSPWWPAANSHSFISANEGKKYFAYRGAGTQGGLASSGLGDVISVDWEGNGSWDHSMIVTKVNNGQRHVNYNTTNEQWKSVQVLVNQYPIAAWATHQTG